MISWTPQALSLFERRCEERRNALWALGADPDEVFADWKALIDTHAADARASTVSADRVQTELEILLVDTPSALDPPVTLPPAAPSTSAFRIWFGRSTTVMLWLLGVILPLGVILFEGLAGLCAEILFDPMPTWWHVLLITLVPIANAAALLTGSRAQTVDTAHPRLRWTGMANGLAIGISAFYALQFALVTPFAVLAIIYFGIGLIPLAPLFAFLCAVALRTRLRRARFLTDVPPPAAWWKTALPVFLLLLLLALPRLMVPVYTPQVNDTDPAVRARATTLLRTFGSRDLMLRRCYRPNVNMDFFSLLLSGSFRLGQTTSRTEAQTTYYRVTGTPYDAVPPPRLKGLRGQDLIDSDWLDPALGGERVSARIRNLTLAQSRLDGRVDTASGIAYLEWTLEFRNASKTQREARALIELPPGAVVSRVTLWINGEPCEAAFGGRSQTRRAYQQIAVRQRRDPVLVTTAGPDRVLLQCFPVPVDGAMKTRIGISVPLVVPDATQAEAALRLPIFVEQNFTAPADLHTTVWLESDQPAVGGAATPLQVSNSDPFSIRGKIPANAAGPAAFLRLPLAHPYPPIAARDSRLPDGLAILQTLDPPTAPPAFPETLAIVIDGSARMRDYRTHMTEHIFDLLPDDMRVCTFIARDETEVIEGKPPERLRFVGGCDNGPALARAAEWAVENGQAPILWLHAAQPLASLELEALRQLADFSRGTVVIHSHQYGPGANRIAEQLADLDIIRPLPVMGNDAADIIDHLQHKAAHWSRRQIASDERPAATAPGSTHIVRLWAADEIKRLSAPLRKTGHDDAVELARTFQLVTPVSGAVVLETAAQYQAHDLKPADPASTPGIVPEPATGLLLLLGTSLLLAWRRRTRT